MHNLKRRLRKIEQRIAPSEKIAIRWVVIPIGSEFAKDPGRVSRAVNTAGIARVEVNIQRGPNGLTEDEWRRFMRAYQENDPDAPPGHPALPPRIDFQYLAWHLRGNSADEPTSAQGQ